MTATWQSGSTWLIRYTNPDVSTSENDGNILLRVGGQQSPLFSHNADDNAGIDYAEKTFTATSATLLVEGQSEDNGFYLSNITVNGSNYASINITDTGYAGGGASTSGTVDVTVRGMDASHNTLATDTEATTFDSSKFYKINVNAIGVDHWGWSINAGSETMMPAGSTYFTINGADYQAAASPGASSTTSTISASYPYGAIQRVTNSYVGMSQHANYHSWQSEDFKVVPMTSPEQFPLAALIGDMENADLRLDSPCFVFSNVTKVKGGFTHYNYPNNSYALNAAVGSGYGYYQQPNAVHGNAFAQPNGAGGDQITQADILSTWPTPYGEYEYDVTITNTTTSWVTFAGIPNMGNSIAYSLREYGGSDTSDYDSRRYRGMAFTIQEVGLTSPCWGTETFSNLSSTTSATNGLNAVFTADTLVAGVGNLNPTTFFNNATVKGHFEVRFSYNGGFSSPRRDQSGSGNGVHHNYSAFHRNSSANQTTLNNTAIMVNGVDSGLRWNDLYDYVNNKYYPKPSQTFTFNNISPTVNESSVYVPLNYSVPEWTSVSFWDGDSSDGDNVVVTDRIFFVVTELTTTVQ